jgi:sirohydrochlorin ferrochelatase
MSFEHNSNNTKGLVIFAHGSSVESANEAVRAVSAALAARGGFPHVETAFLEMGKPDLAGAAEKLMSNGIHQVVIVPYFLTVGIHLKRDLPKLVADLCAAHPSLQVETAPPLDGHPGLVDILLARAEEALAK